MKMNPHVSRIDEKVKELLDSDDARIGIVNLHIENHPLEPVVHSDRRTKAAYVVAALDMFAESRKGPVPRRPRSTMQRVAATMLVALTCAVVVSGLVWALVAIWEAILG